MSGRARVPFYDHGTEYILIREDIDAAIERALLSGEYEQGDEVAAFEREFADYLGMPRAVITGSCHDDMYRGLRALGIGPGDEVITTANTDIACSIAISGRVRRSCLPTLTSVLTTLPRATALPELHRTRERP